MSFRLSPSLRKGLLALGALLLGGASATAQTTITVCANSCDYETIQAAVDAASPGDIVEVGDGTYSENVTITKAITLRSANGRASTTIKGVNGQAAQGTIYVNGTTSGLVIGEPGQGFTIIGLDGVPASERAAIYLKGTHQSLSILDNDVVAAGDEGLLAEAAASLNGIQIEGNTFSGQAFAGSQPGSCGFGSSQFSEANVPRQLVVLGNGGGTAATATQSNITFSNNQITGTAGGSSAVSGCETYGQGNTLVTLDVANSTISGNTFSGITARYGSALRVRRPGTTISGNTFVSTGMGVATSQVFVQNNTAPLQDIAANNTFDKGAYTDGGSTIALAVQGAVAEASSGGTVHVMPGEYVGQVLIDKDLTLQGAGAASTTLQAPTSMASCFSTSSAKYPIVCVTNGATATIDGFTIDGAGHGNGNYQFVGVAFRNAGGTLQNAKVLDIRETPFNGNQHGVAIYSYNDDSVSRAINIWDNEIAGFQKNAMALNAGDTTPMVIDVRRNTVTGIGLTDVTAQNGIQAYGDLITGTIAENTISGIAYDNTANPTKWVASSVLSYFADVDLEDNTITGAQVAAYWYDGSGVISNNEIGVVEAGNGGEWGIIATDPPGAVPAPFDAPPSTAGAVMAGFEAAAPNPITVEVTGNTVTFSGGDNSLAYGIEADSGWGADDLEVTIARNTVSGFGTGIGLYACESECSSGVFTAVSATWNTLAENTIGIDTNLPGPVDASANWWGDTDPSDNVLGNVDYSPWLAAAPGTSPMTWYTNDSVQDAVDAAAAGEAVHVLAGTYAETVNVNKRLVLTGAGSGDDDASNTILSGTGVGTGLTLTPGDDAGNRTSVSGLRVDGFATGITAGSYTTLTDVASVNNASRGLSLGSLEDLVLDGSSFDDNPVGLRVGTGSVIDGLTVTGGSFDGNNIGWYIAEESAQGGVFTNVSVTGTTFNGNLQKGIYAEKMSHATFDGITVDNSGTDPGYGFNNGIDINLKWAAYSDIAIQNSTVSNSGAYGTAPNDLFPAAVAIKARDAGSYASPAASLSGVTLTNVEISGPESALRFGEPGKNNAGPTGVTVTGGSLVGANTSATTGFGLINETQVAISAEGNWWGSAAEDDVLSALGGVGAASVDYMPWVGQAESQTVATANTPTTYTQSGTSTTLNFTTLPPGGGTVSVATYPGLPQGVPAPPGAPIAFSVELNSSMTNHDFEVEVSIDVSGIAGFGPTSRVGYYNSSTSQWVLIDGAYAAGPPATYTFTTDHFTPFAFFNTAATAYDIFVVNDPSDVTSGAIFPNDGWTAPADDDWSFSGSPTVDLYIVPEVGSEFFSSSITIEWDPAVLTYVDAVATGGLFDPSSGSRTFFADEADVAMGAVEIDASRLDAANFTTAAGQYIAKLTFSLLAPGHSPVDLTGMRFRTYDGVGGQADVFVTANGGEVKAYLGDVATDDGGAGDASTGDGLVEFEDLTRFALAYWSSASDDAYKVKYDVGPTADNTVYSLPDVDGEIEFEDLVIFSISYGLSNTSVYPRRGEMPEEETTSEPVAVTLGAASAIGNALHVPVIVSDVTDLRALRAEFGFADGFTVVGAVRPDGDLLPSDVPALQMARATATGATADAAVFGTTGVSGTGAVLELVLQPTTGRAADYDGADDVVRLVSVEMRSSANGLIPADLPETTGAIPTEFFAAPSYPNPVRGVSTVAYGLPEAAHVEIAVYDALGRRVMTLVNEELPAGHHTAAFDAAQLPSGMYVYVVRADAYTATQRVTVIR